MKQIRLGPSPTSEEITDLQAAKLIPPGVSVYADRADYAARGGGANPAPDKGAPYKNWAWPNAQWNWQNPGRWFVYLNPANWQTVTEALSDRITFGVLSQPNFYKTNSASIKFLPKFIIVYEPNSYAERLSIPPSPTFPTNPIPVAMLFEDPTGPIDWLTPDGKIDSGRAVNMRSTFPSDWGVQYRDGMTVAFQISDYKAPPPITGEGTTTSSIRLFRRCRPYLNYTDEQQLSIVLATETGPEAAAVKAATIRKFYGR